MSSIVHARPADDRPCTPRVRLPSKLVLKRAGNVVELVRQIRVDNINLIGSAVDQVNNCISEPEESNCDHQYDKDDNAILKGTHSVLTIKNVHKSVFIGLILLKNVLYMINGGNPDTIKLVFIYLNENPATRSGYVKS